MLHSLTILLLVATMTVVADRSDSSSLGTAASLSSLGKTMATDHSSSSSISRPSLADESTANGFNLPEFAHISGRPFTRQEARAVKRTMALRSRLFEGREAIRRQERWATYYFWEVQEHWDWVYNSIRPWTAKGYRAHQRFLGRLEDLLERMHDEVFKIRQMSKQARTLPTQPTATAAHDMDELHIKARVSLQRLPEIVAQIKANAMKLWAKLEKYRDGRRRYRRRLRWASKEIDMPREHKLSHSLSNDLGVRYTFTRRPA